MIETNDSGVEQVVAREAHNLQVVGSTPTPATVSLTRAQLHEMRTAIGAVIMASDSLDMFGRDGVLSAHDVEDSLKVIARNARLALTLVDAARET